MTNSEKIKAAIAIFKDKLPDAKGSFRAMVSRTNGNIVEITSDGALYCTVDVRGGEVGGL